MHGENNGKISNAVQVFWNATLCLQVNIRIQGQSVQGVHLLGLTGPEYEGDMISHKVGNYTE